MIKNQHIVICLKDSTERDTATYVQVTRKRFTYMGALEYVQGVASSRHPRVVPVPDVTVDAKGYPIKTS